MLTFKLPQNARILDISFQWFITSYYLDSVSATLQVTNGLSGGNWGENHFCPQGSLATSYRQNVSWAGKQFNHNQIM